MMSTKAFTLVPAIEREQLLSDRDRGLLECVECCGRNLYVGTSDCFVYHFLLEEKTLPGGSATFTATRQLHRHLGFKKAVSELRAASALSRLLVLCDGCISLVHMLSLEPVPSGARIKGATAFALNENPVSGDPFCVEVCIISVKRRTIQVFLVYEDRVQIVREVSTPEQPLAVAVDGHFLCLALTTQYIILNYSTGAAQDLFPFCSEERRPIVKRIGRQEFLLAGPGGLGEQGARAPPLTLPLCPVSPPSVLAFMLRLEREVVVAKSRHLWTMFGDIEATGKQPHAQCLLSFH